MTAIHAMSSPKTMSTTFDDTKWHAYTSSTETMRTWAMHIKSYDDLPDAFQPAFPESAQPFPYTLFLPEDTRAKHNEGSKLICLHENAFTLFVYQHGELQTLSSPFADVIYLERGKVLLNSWLMVKTLSGIAFLRFNTTNDHLFQPIIDSIREGMVHGSQRADDGVPNLSAFDYLDKTNFKYMNYGRSSIRAGDEVMDVIYQPEQDIQAIGLFGRTLYRRYKTSHLTVLTAQELILIRESQPVRNNFDPTNGGVFVYIPRRTIQAVSIAPDAEDGLSTLRVSLPEDTQLAVEYSVNVGELAFGL